MKAFFEQRGRSKMAREVEVRLARHAWLSALQVFGDDPAKQPRSESPISVDISAFGVGAKKPQ